MNSSLAVTKYHGPIDYFKIIFRRKKLLIVPAYIGLIIGIMACFLLPPSWRSSTVILVEEEKIINPLIQNLAVSSSAVQRMESIKEIILGWNSLVDLTRKLGLDQNVGSQQGYEDLIMNLRNNIQVQMRQPNIIVLSYVGKNPHETRLITKTLSDILIERNMKSQTKETDVAITFIKDQLDIYKRKIKESEISELQEKLKPLLADSTEEHPMVKELRAKIDAATRELNSGEYEVKGGGEISSANKKALEEELDKMLKDQAAAGPTGGSGILPDQGRPDSNASIYKLMLMDKLNTSLARDMNVNQNIYSMLLQRLETAKITQRLETSREGTRYTVLDPPRLPLKPVKPDKVIVILLGLSFGLVIGVGLVVITEFMDQSIVDVEDAKSNFHLPILGAISRITTQEEIAGEQSANRTLTIVSTILGIFFVAVAMLVSLFRGGPHV